MRLAGISVDPPENNSAMVRKLMLPFPLLSDPQGALVRRCGLWNAEESVAIPSIVVVDRSGMIRYLYRGEDFADRPGDRELFAALDGLMNSGEPGGDKVQPEIRVAVPETKKTVRPDRQPYDLEKLVPYYRGVHFATVALKKRFGAWGPAGKDAFREVGHYQAMIQPYREALDKTIALHKS